VRTIIADNGDKVTESDEIISVVWSWTSEYDNFPAVEHQLTWIKDEPALYYGVKNPVGRWVTTEVRNDDYRPSSHAKARELALKFINGGE
jgi:hypothetical protein